MTPAVARTCKLLLSHIDITWWLTSASESPCPTRYDAVTSLTKEHDTRRVLGSGVRECYSIECGTLQSGCNGRLLGSGVPEGYSLEGGFRQSDCAVAFLWKLCLE